MRVLRPIAVTDAKLISSTIPENDYAPWSSATTYALGAFVISTATHRVYRSLTASNLNNNPDTEQVALADPLIADPTTIRWQVISATNRWKPFAGKPSIVASAALNITDVIAPGEFIRGVAGFGVSAATVTVTMMNGAEQVYERTVVMQDETVVVDWYSFYFEPITELSEFTLTDLPPYVAAQVTVSIDRPSGNVSVGAIVLGPVWDFGIARVEGMGFSGLDFSFVEADEFGNLTTVARAATRLSNFDVYLASAQLLAFDARMRSLRGGVAAVWIGSTDNRKAAVNYGFSRGYRVAYEGVDWSLIQIEVQGIV